MAKKLNERQYAAIALLARCPSMTYEDVAKEVGCGVSTLRLWRNDDTFNDELKRQVMREVVGDLPRVMASVPAHIVDGGNAAMFRTFLQSLGMLTEKHEVESKDSGRGDLDAIRAEIRRMERATAQEDRKD